MKVRVQAGSALAHLNLSSQQQVHFTRFVRQSSYVQAPTIVARVHSRNIHPVSIMNYKCQHFLFDMCFQSLPYVLHVYRNFHKPCLESFDSFVSLSARSKQCRNSYRINNETNFSTPSLPTFSISIYYASREPLDIFLSSWLFALFCLVSSFDSGGSLLQTVLQVL